MTGSHHSPRPRVRQLRLVVEADDFDAAVAFYRDVLGLPEQAAFASDGEARVVILDAGRATLELANPAQKRMIDEGEAGGHTSDRIRVAFEVDDTARVTDELGAAGAALLAAPTVTPWRSLNARLAAPAGLQITLFQELEDEATRAKADGFGTSADRSLTDGSAGRSYDDREI
jgi:catechol 2,3-dioxygenase-like lactoylglutathione lyase family enzyme